MKIIKKAYKLIFYTFCFLSSIFFVAGNKAVAATAGNENGLLNILQSLVKKKPGSLPQDAMDVPNLLVNILEQLINLILYIIPIFALLMIMYAGIQYIFSAGNPTKSGNAVKLLNSSVIGFAAFLMLLSLWRFMVAFIGVDAPLP